MDGNQPKGWNPAMVIFVFALLQGVIIILEWYVIGNLMLQ